MNQEQQTEAFDRELEGLVWRYVEEFDLTVASVIGCLHLMVARVERYALDGDEDCDKNDEEGEEWKV